MSDYGRGPRYGRHRRFSPPPGHRPPSVYSDHGDVYGHYGGYTRGGGGEPVYSSRIYPTEGEHFSRRDPYRDGYVSDGDAEYGGGYGYHGGRRRGDVVVKTIHMVRPETPPPMEPRIEYVKMPTPPPKEPRRVIKYITPERPPTPPDIVMVRRLETPPPPEPRRVTRWVRPPTPPPPPPIVQRRWLPRPPTPEPEVVVQYVQPPTPPTPPPQYVIKRLPPPRTPSPEVILRHVRGPTPPTPEPEIRIIRHPSPPPPEPGVIIREIFPPPLPPQPPQVIYKVTPPAPPPRLALRPVPKQNQVVRPLAIRPAVGAIQTVAQPQQQALMLRPVQQGGTPGMVLKPTQPLVMGGGIGQPVVMGGGIGQPMVMGGQPMIIQGAQQPMYVPHGVFKKPIITNNGYGSLRTM